MTDLPMKAGIMGWPVEHSLSPRLHGWWLKHYKTPGTYVALAVRPEDLGHALRELPAKGFCGANLTIPHKEAALTHLDEIEPSAKRIGAVNTVVVTSKGKLEGRNTDVYGFTQNLLSAKYKPSSRPVAILGAGGAARAAVVALLDMGLEEIRIINRTPERAETLARTFGSSIRIFDWSNINQALENAELLVNATSLGMTGQKSLTLNLDALPKNALVTDMVYVPLETDLLKAARSRGNPTLDGLGMLLHQARPAFKAFFGVDPEATENLKRAVILG